MTLYAAPVVAGLIAGFFCVLELITSKYPRTFFLLKASLPLYAYGAIYGVIGLGVYLLLPAISDQASLRGLGVANPWIRAAAVGLTVKAFFHVRLFDVTTGPGKSFPIGVESLVQIFEPWLLRGIDLDHFSCSKAFLSAKAQQYADVAGVRLRAIQEIPPSFSDSDKAVMESDLNKASTVERVLGVYLTYVGRRTFQTVFP